MDPKKRRQIQLDCLYEMFRDRVEENVIYIVYSENEGKVDLTIDQLVSIASCSFTGHQFGPQLLHARQPFSIDNVEYSNSSDQRGNINKEQNLAQINTSLACDQEKLNISKSKGSSQKYQEQADLIESDTANQEEDEENGLTIKERIERLQKSIDSLLEEKNSSHEKASHYHSKKMYPVISYYSEMACQLRRMIEAKTNKLVDLLLEQCKDSDNIDLHGLNPVQARQVINELLTLRKHKLLIDKQGEASIDIITGWGKHSMNHGHRIRPTIVSLLREKGLKFHHLNKGALRVTITRQ